MTCVPVSGIGTEIKSGNLKAPKLGYLRLDQNKLTGKPSDSIKPSFTPRPESGTKGTKCIVKENHFLAELPNIDIYHVQSMDVRVIARPKPHGTLELTGPILQVDLMTDYQIGPSPFFMMREESLLRDHLGGNLMLQFRT
ncbi:hypothetical protein LIER_23684 [Lithospermum erythrorhizon]|uniref:Uncharacterized protein n=1 Tax=Lithospermum erythrorhizon TaxID=34254 RepID=A0AAV3R436_LITER